MPVVLSLYLSGIYQIKIIDKNSLLYNMTTITAQRAPHSASNFAPAVEANAYGMNERIKRLRQETFEAEPSLSIERALIETRFYKENYGKISDSDSSGHEFL